MESAPKSPDSFDYEAYLASLRKFTENFTAAWYGLSSDHTEQGAKTMKTALNEMVKTDGLPNMLNNALAAIQTVDSVEQHIQILALLSALGYIANTEEATNTLELLYETDSPLWQDKDRLGYLSIIALRIPSQSLAECIVEIAKSISENSVEVGEVYRRHLGRLTDVLLTARSGTESEEEIAVLEEAMCQIADLRDGLRIDVLGEIEKEDTSLYGEVEFRERQIAKAESEIEALPDEIDTSRLMPMYYLKSIRHRETGEYINQAELEYPQMIDRHNLKTLETFPHPATPTIGIEIEVRERDILPPEAAEWTSEEKSLFLMKLKDQFDTLDYSGVPADHEDTVAFHEFAFRPKHNYLTISREVQMLKKRGYIPEGLRPPVMHITVGGLHAKLDDRNESEALALCRIMEATKWSTSHRRLLKKYPPVVRTRNDLETSIGWDSKGLSGVLDKKHDVFLEPSDRTDTEMVEFRTFQLRSLAGMNRTLASFQTLAAAAVAAQSLRATGEEVAHEAPDTDHTLARIWHEFEYKVKELFSKYGLENPKSPYTALQPENDKKERYVNTLGADAASRRSGFYDFSELLRQSEEDSDSNGKSFVTEARRLVVAACAEISPILFSRNDPVNDNTVESGRSEDYPQRVIEFI